MRVKKFTLIFFLYSSTNKNTNPLLSEMVIDMKKLTLAVVLALCGARVYGQLPQEVAVKPEDILAAKTLIETTLNTTLKDPRTVEALSEQLNVPPTEVKSWAARHKALTGAGSLLGVYATLLALSCCSKEARWSDASGVLYDVNNTQLSLKGTDGKELHVTTMIKIRDALLTLKWTQKPFIWGKDHKVAAIVVALLATAITWDLCQGKDSTIVAGVNKLFGKKEIAPATAEVVVPSAA